MSGERRCPTADRGFTLIELLVVLAAMGLLLSLAAPRYFEHVDRSREVVLRHNLHGIRAAIDKFLADKGRHPISIAELVLERYLRELPLDPVTERSDTWIVVPPPGRSEGAGDIRSGARGVARDGTTYASW